MNLLCWYTWWGFSQHLFLINSILGNCSLVCFYSLAKMFLLITSIHENCSLLIFIRGLIFYQSRNEEQHDLVWGLLLRQWFVLLSEGERRITGITTCWLWYVNITQNDQLLFSQSHVYISQLLKRRQQCFTNNSSYNSNF